MDHPVTESLASLRRQIDTIDDEIMGLLKRRMGIIHDVGALKREHTPAACHIRPGREGEMHRRIHAAFKDSDFSPAAALLIWRQIIGSSTHLESPIVIAPAKGVERWQAREYFGRAVTCLAPVSIREALAAVMGKNATIALLPAPTDDSLVDWAALAEMKQLRVFAALPVVLAEGESPACYAVAAVKNEPSGDDMSLLLVPAADAAQYRFIFARNAQHALVAVGGLHDGAESLGTFPAPIIDPSLQPW